MRVIDLTYVLRPGRELRQLQITPLNVLETHGSTSFTITLNNHIGTHVECPSHNLRTGKSIDQMPVAAFVGEAEVLDLTFRVNDREITEADLGAVGAGVHAGDIVLLMTRYDEQFQPDEMQSVQYQARSPYLTDGATRWLIRRGVKLVGIDFWSIEAYPIGPEGEPKHVLLFHEDIPLLHSLTNLAALRQPRVFFIALPLPIAGVDSMPVRAVAIEF